MALQPTQIKKAIPTIVSVVGLLLVAIGAFDMMLSKEVTWSSVVFVGFGRILDMVDGWAARRLGASTRFGGAVDAVLDKIALFLILIPLIALPLMPYWISALIVIHNFVNAFIAFRSHVRDVELDVSREGKHAAFLMWGVISGYILANSDLLSAQQTDVLLITLLPIVAIYVLLSAVAATNYARLVLHGPARAESDPNDVGIADDIHSCLIIYNPSATNIEKTDALIRDIAELGYDMDLLDISTFTNEHAIADDVAKRAIKASGNILVCIAGGDGTVSTVLNGFMSGDDATILSKLVVLPLWGGNANDIACMLNGNVRSTSVEQILNQGKIIQVNPIEVTVMRPDQKKRIYRAFAYVSFGVSAQATWMMERFSHSRESKWLRPPVVRLFAEILDATTAFITHKHHEVVHDDQVHKIYEHAFINGSRVAKLERFPLRLDDNAYFEISAHDRRYRIVTNIAKAMLHLDRGSVGTRQQTFTLATNTRIQIDGEHLLGLPESKVSVKISEEYVKMLASRPMYVGGSKH